MLNCVKIRKKFLPYLDNCLGGTEKKRLESHLERCQSCRQKLEELQQTGDFLRAQERAIRSPEFWSDFEVTLRQKTDEQIEVKKVPEWSYRWYPRLVPAGALAFLLVLAVLGGLIGTRVFRAVTGPKQPGFQQARQEQLARRRRVPEETGKPEEIKLAGLFYQDSAGIRAGVFSTLELAKDYPEFRELVRTEKSEQRLARGAIIFVPVAVIGRQEDSRELFPPDYNGEGISL